MQLTHTFEIAAPVDQVFDVFGRLDLLAPCFPGASVWGRDGEVYHGAVKIKFGPFPLVFEGTARVVRADLAERRLVVKANARDRRGAAAGAATVTATFSAKGSDRTWVEVATDLDLTGRPAQLGSGTISSVSDRLADQFVGCISAKLAAGLAASEACRRRRPPTRYPAAPAPEPTRSPASAAARVRLPAPDDLGVGPAPAGAPGHRPYLAALGGRRGRRSGGAGAPRPLAASALSPARGVRVVRSHPVRGERLCPAAPVGSVAADRPGRRRGVRAGHDRTGRRARRAGGRGRRVRGDRATGSARGDRARPGGRAAALPVQRALPGRGRISRC